MTLLFADLTPDVLSLSRQIEHGVPRNLQHDLSVKLSREYEPVIDDLDRAIIFAAYQNRAAIP